LFGLPEGCFFFARVKFALEPRQSFASLAVRNARITACIALAPALGNVIKSALLLTRDAKKIGGTQPKRAAGCLIGCCETGLCKYWGRVQPHSSAPSWPRSP